MTSTALDAVQLDVIVSDVVGTLVDEDGSWTPAAERPAVAARVGNPSALHAPPTQTSPPPYQPKGSGRVTAIVDPLPGVALEPHEGTELRVRRLSDTAVEVTARSADGLPGVRAEVDLGAAVAYWRPGSHREPTLPPDWAAPVVTSLVDSAPVGALYDASGRVLLGWAAGEATAELSVRAGVSEERNTFSVEVRPVFPLPGELVLLLDSRPEQLAVSARRLAGWLSDRCGGAPLVPPAVGRQPVYSTWYTFTQDVDHAVVTAEAEAAVELGCGSVFIDDGWQRHGRGRGYQGCGDWLPDTDKFPDLAATVGSIHDLGAGVALWVAPLLLGPESDVAESLGRYAPARQEALNCQVLDPRYAEVRDFVADTCTRLVCDYDLDLLKIDFLDQAMTYRGTDGGDIPDIGQAMATMLADVRRRLADAGRDQVAFEFRQPYVSPAVARYGQILRAGDCPADSLVNRASVLDARLVSVGQVVHADPMMWGPGGGPEAVAQQLYAGWFAVPQISMRLTELDAGQADALRGLLALWRRDAEVTLDGVLDTRGAERGHDLVRAVRADLGRTVVVRYAPVTVDVDHGATAETTVVNATSDPRVTLRLARPITAGVIRSAGAAEVGTVAARGPGLTEIVVPPFGSVTLQC